MKITRNLLNNRANKQTSTLRQKHTLDVYNFLEVMINGFIIQLKNLYNLELGPLRVFGKCIFANVSGLKTSL